MPDISVREAVPADGPMLADLERRTPLRFAGGDAVAIDRDGDYFAASRLMPDCTVLVGEVDGEPGGVIAGALHEAQVGGVRRRLLYVHHARILPAFQRIGLGRRLAGALSEHYSGRFDSQYWYISPANPASQAFAATASNRWSFGPAWLNVPCAKLAAGGAGRPAAPADAHWVAAVLNQCHAGEEMFEPCTVDSLAARLGRDPAQYGWGNLRVAASAVAGAWFEGKTVASHYRGADGSRTTTRAVAIPDYGFLPGGKADLLALLGAIAAEALDAGMTEMLLFSSPDTRAWPVLARLPGERRPFDFWTPGIPEPPGARDRGLYVDHLLF
jgi:hypothetical protein